MKFFCNHKTELTLFALALIFRFVFFWFNIEAHNKNLFPTILRSESYYEIANNIIAGHGFSGETREPFTPESLRTPFYPLFIAAILKIFGTYWAVMIIQILIGSILTVLAKRVCYQILENKKIAIGVGIFFAVEPLLVRLSSVLLTETLFLAFFLGFLLSLYKYLSNEKFIYLVFGAILLGLSTLTRPITQYLQFFIVVFLIWHFRDNLFCRRVVHIAAFVLVSLLMLAPWSYRNYLVFGNPSLAVTKAVNLYDYFVPSILALEKDISYNEAKTKFLAEENTPAGVDIINLKIADRFTRRSIEIIKNHPFGAFKVLTLTTFSLFVNDGYLDVVQDLGYLKTGVPAIPVFKIIQSPQLTWRIISELVKSPGIVIIIGRIFWILMAFLFLVGVVLRVKRKGWRQSKFLFSLLMIVYFVCTSAVVGLGVTARYRTPINVFIASFAFYAISRREKPQKIGVLPPDKPN